MRNILKIFSLIFIFHGAAVAQPTDQAPSDKWITKNNLEKALQEALRNDVDPGLDWRIVAALIAFAGVIITQIITYNLSKSNLSAEGNQSRNLAEIKKIDDLLNNFYGKIILYLARTHLFAQDLRQRQPEGYRMLTSLFDKTWKANLSNADKAIVEQVCVAAEELDSLISDNLGYVDDSMLEYFVHASAHFRILSLAYQDRLGEDPTPWTLYVYPKPFDPIIRMKCEKLRSRKQLLQASLSKFHEPEPDLRIPDDEKYLLQKLPDPDGRLSFLLGSSPV